MVDVALSLGRLLAAFFLVFLNGFFVAAEFAYVRIRSTAVDQMVEEGKPGAETLQGTLAPGRLSRGDSKPGDHHRLARPGVDR